MYRILVVDDESYITDSLTRLLRAQDDGQLDVYAAYSGDEAMSLLHRAGFDVVVTDIQMPGITGLELLRRIKRLYPSCRVIFLSGHDEFDYAYQALQYHAARYVLKSDGDEALLSAVRECLREADSDAKRQEVLDKARDQLAQCRPILRREYLGDLMEGAGHACARTEEDFARLGIELDLRAPLILLAGRLEGDALSDTAIKADLTVRECLGSAVRCEMAVAKRAFLLWLIQPIQAEDAGDAITLVRGCADRLQRACAQTLPVPLSFVLDTSETRWEELPAKSTALYHAMVCMLNKNERQAFLYLDFFGKGEERREETPPWQTRAEEALRAVRQALQDADAEALEKAYTELMLCLAPHLSPEAPAVLPAVTRLHAMLISFLDERGLLDDLEGDQLLRAFLTQPTAGTRAQQLARFLPLCKRALGIWSARQRTRDQALVGAIDLYIRAHLKEELSLLTLSERVYLNPSYLSRRYKELTGRNITDAVSRARMDKACELLSDPQMKINRIAEETGYTSATYFSRVFKHLLGVTPQEWRDRARKT